MFLENKVIIRYFNFRDFACLSYNSRMHRFLDGRTFFTSYIISYYFQRNNRILDSHVYP